MVKPQVTITLGRSGQRVVKDSREGSNGGRGNPSVPSGSKRSMAESFGTGGGRPFRNNKRIREDVNARAYGSGSHVGGYKDSRLGPRDLRRKLTRKRISRCMEIENEERRKVELQEKVSRAIRSLESPDRNLTRSMAHSRGVAGSPSMRSTYATWTDGARSGMSTLGSAIDERQRVSSMRTMDASRTRTERVFVSNPMPPMARRPLDSGKFIAELPPATGAMSRSPYQDAQPLAAQPITVSGLLHSLGLGKYCINFKAEEIDMVALKQMGDIDLKELGIPMGPRKKILLALQARAKRPVAQAHMNYMQ